MSKVVKGVKKAFKKVTKVVKKVAPVALAVGALVFTGGAALGAGFAAGGWGKAASALATKFGLSGGLANVVTGAVTQAGYGALTGGVLAELGGGSFKDGLEKGALAGAVTGGVMGGLGMQTDPLAGAFDKGTNAPVAGGPARQVSAGAGGASVDATGVGVEVARPDGIVGGVPTGGGKGGLLGPNGWVERNQELAGGIVKGLGQGLLAAGEDEKEILRERYRLERENYAGTNPGQRYRGLSQAPEAGAPLPGRKYDDQMQGFEYRYNPQQGRIERVRRSAPA